MRFFRFLVLPILLLCSSVDASDSPTCSDQYTRSAKMSKSSEVYIVRAEAGFNIQGVDVFRFFKNISDRQTPSYKCDFYNSRYGIYYEEGFCVNLETQKKFPIWENSSKFSPCTSAGDACSLIYDNQSIPLQIKGTELYHTLYSINVNTDQNWHLISDCSDGKIEAITIFEQRGVIILLNSTETGFKLK